MIPRGGAGGSVGGAIAFVFLLLTAGLSAARADILLTQEVESAGGRGEMTIRFHEGKIRTDLAEPVSILFDAATGETRYLQHRSKTYSRVTREQSETLAAKLREATPAGTGGKLEATGQKQEIAGHPTELYLWSIAGLRLRFWVARDVPKAEVLNNLLDRLQTSGPAAATAGLMPSRAALPGVRLRTEMEVGGQRVTYTILSIRDAPSDEAPFRVPADYKETPFAVAP